MRRLVLFFSLSLMSLQFAVSQEVVEYNGLSYRITDGEAAVVSDSKESSIDAWSHYSGEIVIPEEIQVDGKAYRVTRIEAYAFHRSEVTSVDIPNTVLKIDNFAFANSRSLKTVILRGYSEIGTGAFWCENATILLDKVVCYSSVPPKCDNDCFNAFYDWVANEKRDVTLEVPKGFADIYASSIFWYEFNISEIDVEAFSPTTDTYETETRLVQNDEGVWYRLTKGDGVLEAAVTPYHYLPFMEKSSSYITRSELVIPEKLVLSDRLEFVVTGIDDKAFSSEEGGADEWCSFQTLILPGSIRHIGDDAFYGCGRLKTIYCNAVTPSSCTERSFPSDNSGIVVYVPQGCKAVYEQSSGWSALTIVEADNTGIDAPIFGSIDDDRLFDLLGRRLIQKPSKGLYIRNGKIIVFP